MTEQWDEIFKKHEDVFERSHEYMKKLSKKLKEMRFKRILDLGCGTGRHLLCLSKLGFDVHGINSSETGAKLSRKRLEEKNLKTNLKIGDIYDGLPYPENFFDAIISTQVIHHSTIDKIRKLVKEIERVLKPIGLIFITVPKTKKTQRGAKKYRKIVPRTFTPLDGEEKGLPHFYFNKKLIKKEFSNFNLKNIWIDSGLHYCFIGELK